MPTSKAAQIPSAPAHHLANITYVSIQRLYVHARDVSTAPISSGLDGAEERAAEARDCTVWIQRSTQILLQRQLELPPSSTHGRGRGCHAQGARAMNPD